MSDELVDIETVVGGHTGRARTVLELTLEMKRIIDLAKEPGFDESGWEPLTRFIDVDAFERIGPFKDRMVWPEYVAYLTAWATRRHWECSLRDVTEVGDTVFLELEERSAPGDHEGAANSLSRYDFGPDGRLRRLAVHLQMVMPT